MSAIDDIENYKQEEIQIKDYETGNISEAFESLVWYVERKKKYWMLGNKSRYPEIDKKTEGYIPWSVYTIWAYSNVGKSRFSYWEVNQALILWKKVCYFSLEEMKGIVLRNLICNRNTIRPKELFWDQELKDCFSDQFKNLYLYDSVFDIEGMERTIKRIQPDYVFIDFIQNVQTSQNGSAYEKMSSIAKQTQRIAIQNKCVLVQLSQVSNSIGKQLASGDTDFISLKGAGELFASSDVIFILYKWDMQEFYLHVAKNKYWQAKDNFCFIPEWETSTFTLDNSY